MFTPTDETVLLKTKSGFKVAPVYESTTDSTLFAKNGQMFIQLYECKRTTNPSIRWERFSDITPTGRDTHGRLKF